MQFLSLYLSPVSLMQIEVTLFILNKNSHRGKGQLAEMFLPFIIQSKRVKEVDDSGPQPRV